MPTAFLTYRTEHEAVAAVIARAVPGLIAPAVNIEGAPIHQGGVTEKEVIVRLVEGSVSDVNAPDINIYVRAHNFPARVVNDQERAEQIYDAVRDYLDTSPFKLTGLSLSTELGLQNLGYKASYPDTK